MRFSGKGMTDADEDRLIAAVDLAARTGAREFQVGYLHDGVPVERAAWYAHAQYKGARLTAEDHPGPAQAAEALAIRLLTGAQCQHCKGLIALDPSGAVAFRSATLVDGRRWDAQDAAATRQCLWTRTGRRWDRSCHHRPPGPEVNDPAAFRAQGGWRP